MSAPLRRGVRLALDWGEARIGVASCDPAGMLAYPYTTVAAGPNELATIAALVRETGPIEIIVGLPRSLSGGEGPAAVRTRARALALASTLAGSAPAVAVRLVDERLTTVTASRQLREGGRKVRDQRSVIDAAAAVTILEHALAAERAQGTAPGELVSATVRPDSPGRTAETAQTGETEQAGEVS